jgi:hypothetical protein
MIATADMPGTAAVGALAQGVSLLEAKLVKSPHKVEY